MEVISGGYNIPSLSAICHEYCNGHKGEHLEILDGEDVHVGLYKKDEESIRVAIWRTMRHLANKLKPITSKMIGVDLGCEIGGSARYAQMLKILDAKALANGGPRMLQLFSKEASTIVLIL